jgi:tripartite-type tricarboxylate transporter receptor subunit TctC
VGVFIVSIRLLVALFRKETRTHFAVVPYRGSTPAMQDLVAGQIDLVFDATGLPFVRAGSIKAYAVTSDARLALAPDIPTFAEIGMPALSFSAWAGLFAPRGTPKDIIGKLNAAVVEALADPAVRSRIVELGCPRNEGSRERRLTASTTAARFAYCSPRGESTPAEAGPSQKIRAHQTV